MSEATEAEQTPAARAPRKKATSLNTMLIADLKALAGGLGIQGSGSMKKAQLVEAIKAYQDQHSQAPRASRKQEQPAAEQPSSAPRDQQEAPQQGSTQHAPKQQAPSAGEAAEQGDGAQERRGRNRQRNRDARQDVDAAQGGEQATDGSSDGDQGRQQNRPGGRQNRQQDGRQQDSQKQQDAKQSEKQDGQKQQDGQKGQKQGQKKQGNQGQADKQGNQGNQGPSDKQGQDRRNQDNQSQRSQTGPEHDEDEDEDGEGGGRRNRRRRGRERNTSRQGRSEPDTTILDDDVLVPAAGILDVLDNYAFVRTSGYLPGTDDVYLSLSMVRKYGLRRGDAVVGQVRQPREGERKEKFNPMVRVDQVNGLDPEAAKERPEFDAFVPVHPSERLRLETGPENLLGRIVDVFAPIGKGQRGMVLSPPRSGKTQVLQTIAGAIRHNNPECHVMVVLVDERPEEVTDYQRTIRGEVVASTFDRPAADHVLLAELAVERAKRLVELGHDVVLLLDSLTRLARAFNVAAPGSGRQGHGGVDAVALHPAKRLFGAARNVEDGGSLTILATALVESGSPLDEAVLDEFNDTGNMELRLRRELIERRIFPPVDVVSSGTRREEHLLTEEEQQITFRLRSALTDLEPREALGRVLERMAKSSGNVDFLSQVQRASDSELSGR